MSRPRRDLATFEQQFAEVLRTNAFGRSVRWHASVESTNVEALAWAEEGAPEGSVVGSDHQRKGRGRHARTWTDSPGQNLLFSVVLRPTFPSAQWSLIPLTAGVAVASAIEEQADLSPSLKWPNDVLLGGRKVSGLLLEGQLQARQSVNNHLVLGIGLNVNQVDFSPDIEHTATSIALELGRPVPRLPLVCAILEHLEAGYERLTIDRGEHMLSAFRRRLVGVGDRVNVSGAGVETTGMMLGIAGDGALLLRTSFGEKAFHAGDVSLSMNGMLLD